MKDLQDMIENLIGPDRTLNDEQLRRVRVAVVETLNANIDGLKDRLSGVIDAPQLLALMLTLEKMKGGSLV